MLTLFIDKQCLKSLNLPCLDHHIQLLDMAITRFCFVLDLGKKKAFLYLLVVTHNEPIFR